ncbi:MAG: hypothetical protein LUP95_05075, partial [Euryarchaeota archaeon]|nr:hypothetical protein [Euryarchaeota archaeon]
MAIEQKLFEEKFRPTGGAIKSVRSEGVETEFSITSEITGFGKAQGLKGTNMGTLHNLTQNGGIGTGTGLGVGVGPTYARAEAPNSKHNAYRQ